MHPTLITSLVSYKISRGLTCWFLFTTAKHYFTTIYKLSEHTSAIWPQRLAFFLHTVKGIRKLHSANIVHADLKPENVMINCDKPCADPRNRENPGLPIQCDPENPSKTQNMAARSCVAVVIDVGLAVEAGKDDSLRGTPGFISKELVVAELARQADRRKGLEGKYPVYQKSVDIFALGAMLYELHTNIPLIPAVSGCETNDCWYRATKAYKPNGISGVHDFKLKTLISEMTADDPESRHDIDYVVDEVDKLLKKEDPTGYDEHVKDPYERGALQAVPACLQNI